MSTKLIFTLHDDVNGPKFNEFVLIMRALYNFNATTVARPESKSVEVNCSYLVGNKRINEKLGQLVQFVSFRRPLQGFTEGDETEAQSLLFKYGCKQGAATPSDEADDADKEPTHAYQKTQRDNRKRAVPKDRSGGVQKRMRRSVPTSSQFDDPDRTQLTPEGETD